MLPDTFIIKRSIPMAESQSNWGCKKYPTITLYPIGDLHLGAIGFNEKAWADFCDFISNEPDSYVILVGDMVDNSTRNTRVANPFENKYRPMEQKNILAEYLKPIAPKVLASVDGNHEQRTWKESDQCILYDVLCRLNIETVHRMGTAFLYLQIGERTNGKRGIRPISSYNIVVTHGTGGGKLAGSAINNQQRFAYACDGVDVLISGHTHAPSVTKPSKIVFDAVRAEIRTEPFLCVQSSSWLSYVGYPLQKMLAPQTAFDNNSPQKIELCCQRDVKLIRATM